MGVGIWSRRKVPPAGVKYSQLVVVGPRHDQRIELKVTEEMPDYPVSDTAILWLERKGEKK